MGIFVGFYYKWTNYTKSLRVSIRDIRLFVLFVIPAHLQCRSFSEPYQQNAKAQRRKGAKNEKPPLSTFFKKLQNPLESEIFSEMHSGFVPLKSRLFNLFCMNGSRQRRLTTEGTEGTESCCFLCVLCVLCALCGFPNPHQKIMKSVINECHEYVNRQISPYF